MSELRVTDSMPFFWPDDKWRAWVRSVYGQKRDNRERDRLAVEKSQETVYTKGAKGNANVRRTRR